MKSNRKFFRALLLLSGILLFVAGPRPAQAAPSCSFSAVPSINFGTTLDPLFPAYTAVSGVVTLHCTGNTAFITMSFNAGANSGGSFLPRKLKDGNGNTLNYNCYSDAGHTTILGDGTGSTITETQGATSGNHSYSVTMFCQLPDANTTLATAGNPDIGVSYSDTITVTATFM